jgi:hypothetical protein
MKTALVSFVLVLLVGLAAIHADAQTVSDAGAGSAVVAVDAGAGNGSAVTPAPATGSGSGSAIAPLPQAGDVVDPIQQPIAALSEFQLAKKTGWPLAVLLVLVMVTHGLAYFETTSVGAWLAVGTRASVISAAGTMIAAAYNAVLMGGTLTAALVAASSSFFLLKNAKAGKKSAA